MLNRIGRRIGKAALLLLCVALWFAGGAVASSVLQVYQGGTGASALSAHGAAVINSTGTAITTIAPGSNGNTLQSNGTDWISAAATGGISREAWVSGCRLTIDTGSPPAPVADKASGTTLYLVPFVSNIIWTYDSSVWTQHTIASSGISITNSGLPALATYYVYCYNNSGAMTLVLNTDGQASQDGVLVDTNHHNYTFIGFIYTDGSSKFNDTYSNRNVSNYYNEVRRGVNSESGSTPTSSSTTPVALASIQCTITVCVTQTVTWHMDCTGVYNNTANDYVYWGVGSNTTTLLNSSYYNEYVNTAGNYPSNGTGIAIPETLGIGVYTRYALGSVNGGIGNWVNPALTASVNN